MRSKNLKLDLQNRIKNKTATVGVIGIGYVGSALSKSTAGAGFKTLGFDIDQEKIDSFNKQNLPNFSATDDFSKVSTCQIICICVPTPIDKNKKPNLGILEKTLGDVSSYLAPGTLVVLESSVAPGTTRNFVLPILEKSTLIAGRDFFLAFSPERIDPANTKFTVKSTPKVVSGVEENSQNLVYQFYKSFVDQVVVVATCEVAEMTKVLENTFRLVNISLVNEIAAFCQEAQIDIWEVIKAASTKPYGFLTHYPGPGAGGDCIPVLPYHLLDSAKALEIPLRVVKAAVRVNEIQPNIVVNKAIEVINGKFTKNGHNPKVFLIGISYKEETGDIRHSPALEIWHKLKSKGMTISYHDPYIPKFNGSMSERITKDTLTDHDLIIITTAHKNVPYEEVVNSSRPIIDTRNVLSNYRQSHIIRL